MTVVHKAFGLHKLFTTHTVDGKLYLRNIDFSRLGPTLTGIDFTNCILENCGFDYLTMTDCSFEHADINSCHFQGTLLKDTLGLNTTATSSRQQITFFKTDSDTLNNQRLEQWKKYNFSKYPLDFLHYDTLNEIPDSRMHYAEDHYYWVVYPHGDLVFEEWLGWKLHLSISRRDLKSVIDIIAPVLIQYDVAFRILEIDHPTEKTLSDSTRITIYLEHKHNITVQENQVTELIRTIDQLLQDNNIAPGSKPKADAATFSEYFSIRNDKVKLTFMIFNLVLGKNLYYEGSKYVNTEKLSGVIQSLPYERLTACQQFNHFNPFFNDNPFPSIIDKSTTDFNMSQLLNAALSQESFFFDVRQIFILLLSLNVNRIVPWETIQANHEVLIVLLTGDAPLEMINTRSTNISREIVNVLKLSMLILMYSEKYFFDHISFFENILESKIFKTLSLPAEFQHFFIVAEKIFSKKQPEEVKKPKESNRNLFANNLDKNDFDTFVFQYLIEFLEKYCTAHDITSSAVCNSQDISDNELCNTQTQRLHSLKSLAQYSPAISAFIIGKRLKEEDNVPVTLEELQTLQSRLQEDPVFNHLATDIQTVIDTRYSNDAPNSSDHNVASGSFSPQAGSGH